MRDARCTLMPDYIGVGDLMTELLVRTANIDVVDGARRLWKPPYNALHAYRIGAWHEYSSAAPRG